MGKYVLLFILVLALVVLLQASTIAKEYGTYLEKLQKERDLLSDKRDLSAKARKRDNNVDELTKRRELLDEIRRKESSFPQEEYF